MIRSILTYGIAAGLIVAVPMCILVGTADPGDAVTSPLVGYLIMIIALSLIFVGVKRFRDHALGGVIRFVPALLMGLGISAVAGVLYVVGWEITLALTEFRFIDLYSTAAVDAARAKGASAAELAALTAQLEGFRAQYMNPLIRLPITFVEIFPVGVVVSLISAALLRNSRFLPAQPRPA